MQTPWMILFFSSLGFLSLLKPTLSLLKWAFITFLRPPKNLTKNYGSWALITGSTDGIGKAFAIQLAQKGLNLILVSRNPEKLKQVSDEISSMYPKTRVKTVAIDFSDEGVGPRVKEMVENIIDEEGLEVGVLVNNVGMTYQAARFFHEVGEDVWRRIVRVNVESTTLVTRGVLPGMLKRRRGAIVNIGSGAASVVPSHPLFAIYAATKAYVDQFSRSLHVEYKHHGIDVQCQVPLYVSTNMASQVASVEKSSMFIPSAEDYARAAIRCIGYEARCTPYWAHSIQWFFASMVPEPLLDASRLSIGINRRKASIAKEMWLDKEYKAPKES